MASRPLGERIAPSYGLSRVPGGAATEFFRSLPVKAGRPPVRLHDGREKRNQGAHYLVLDIEVGRRDLQQCADAAIRLWAEMLWARGDGNSICFRFTSGDRASWSEFATGMRPKVSGSKVRWTRSAKPDRSYRSFRRYLDLVFTYAGSASLARGLTRVPDARTIRIGDVLLQGGFPGHAVIVVDLARDRSGAPHVLLAQSYMPAQEIHVLKHPGSESPWYPVGQGRVVTPEWVFDWSADLYRFEPDSCP